VCRVVRHLSPHSSFSPVLLVVSPVAGAALRLQRKCQIWFTAAASMAPQSLYRRRYVGVTLKCLPHEKSARKEIITELICVPLIKISPAPWKSIPLGLWNRPPQKSLPPGRQFTGKKPSRPGGRRGGGCLPVNCRTGDTFLREAILYWGTGLCRPMSYLSSTRRCVLDENEMFHKMKHCTHLFYGQHIFVIG